MSQGIGSKRVVVVSPLRAANGRTQQANERLAEDLCREVARNGFAPYAPHIFCTRFLDEKSPVEREAGISIGLAWLAAADEVWVYGKLGVSSGMQREIEFATQAGIPVIYPKEWQP